MIHWSRRLATQCVCAVLLSGCAHLSFRNTEWTYLHPPKPHDSARFPLYGVWCDSAQKAIFMATTGFFADGCTSVMPATTGSYTVTHIEHIAQNDVRAWVVEVMDAAGNRLWIPLPDHNWA